MDKQKLILGISLLAVVLAGSWLLTLPNVAPSKPLALEHVGDEGSGILDGLEFSGAVTTSKSTVAKDRFLFSKGKFVSTECVKRCGYLPGAYSVLNRDGKTEFISESRCTYKDAKIVWRGSVADGVVKGVSTWTVSRWYRTVETKFQFEGKLVKSPTPIAQK